MGGIAFYHKNKRPFLQTVTARKYKSFRPADLQRSQKIVISQLLAG